MSARVVLETAAQAHVVEVLPRELAVDLALLAVQEEQVLVAEEGDVAAAAEDAVEVVEAVEVEVEEEEAVEEEVEVCFIPPIEFTGECMLILQTKQVDVNLSQLMIYLDMIQSCFLALPSIPWLSRPRYLPLPLYRYIQVLPRTSS